MDGSEVFLFDKTKGEPVLKKGFQGAVYAIYVGNDDGRAVLRSPVDAVMAEGVGKFFQCAYAAGKDNEGVAGFYHFLLPCNHVRHFQKLRNAPVGLFLFNEHLGDDAGDSAACGHGGIGGKAHEAHGAAAVNHMEAPFPQGFAQPSGQGGKGWIVSEMGTAVDHDVCIFGHSFSFFLR